MDTLGTIVCFNSRKFVKPVTQRQGVLKHVHPHLIELIPQSYTCSLLGPACIENDQLSPRTSKRRILEQRIIIHMLVLAASRSICADT